MIQNYIPVPYFVLAYHIFPFMYAFYPIKKDTSWRKKRLKTLKTCIIIAELGTSPNRIWYGKLLYTQAPAFKTDLPNYKGTMW
jgi:hypothetical protein